MICKTLTAIRRTGSVSGRPITGEYIFSISLRPLSINGNTWSRMSVRFFVYIPMPLAAALSVEGDKEVSRELLSRNELHLVRKSAAPVRAKKRA